MDISEDIYQHLNTSKDYIDLVDKLTYNQTYNLDIVIKEITDIIKKPDYIISIDELQPYYLKLATELYITMDKLRQFEIYSALAKSTQTESYNNAYLSEATSYEKKPSATELQIRAENKTLKESLINTVYASAFKAIKNKIDAGNMVADTIKNIIKTKLNVDYSSNQLDNTNTYRS